jgi:hypothetical protein
MSGLGMSASLSRPFIPKPPTTSGPSLSFAFASGAEDGIVDATFACSRSVTDGDCWCPPVRSGKLDLRFVGLQV